MFRNVYLTVLALCIAASASAQGSSQLFSKLVIFSGSLSDTGNCVSINCAPFPSPPFFNGRSTNGPDEADVMASLLALSSAPSLNLIGPEQGTNYAVFGALAAGNGKIDLPAQVSAYLQPRNQIADPAALYFFFIGGNDVLNAVFQSDSAAQVTLEDAAVAIDNNIRRIVHAGGKTILVGNFLDIGTAPGFLAAGLSPTATKRSVLFNKLLAQRMQIAERTLGIHVLKFDFFKFGQEFFATSAKLGFTDTTHSCQASPACDFNRFAFLDDEFPTARVHQLLGNKIVDTLIDELSQTLRPGYSFWGDDDE